jgi:TonB family protein
MKKNLFCLAMALFFGLCICLSAQAQTPAPDEDKVYGQSEVDTKAVIARHQHPQTNGGCAARSRGTIAFRLILRRSGEAEIVGSSQSSGCETFDRNAYEVASKLKFTPAMKDGKPVSVRTQIQYSYFVY